MDAVEEFLSRYEKRSTRQTYQSLLKSFLSCNNVKGQYFGRSREYEQDVSCFAKSLSAKPSKSVHASLSVVRMFLLFGGVKLKEEFWHSLPGWSKKNRSVSKSRVPSNDEMRQILVFGEPKARALFLLLSSSGLRMEEALKLRLQDVDVSSSPKKAVVFENETYVGPKRSVFFSSEAADAISVWLKQRDSYLFASAGKDNFRKNKKSVVDNRLFPFSYNVARSMWVRLLKKSGFDMVDESTDRLVFGLSSLRRFFMTRASLCMPGEVVDAFLGRVDAVEQAYKKYGQKGIEQMYKRAVNEFAIFALPSDDSYVKKLEAELKLRDVRLSQLEDQVKSHEVFFEGIDALARERLGEQFASMLLAGQQSEYVDEYAKYRKREEEE